MAKRSSLQVLESRVLRRFALSRFLRSAAQTGFAATVSWHLYDLTGSAAALGLLGVVEFLPVLPVGLWAGALADARERVGIVQRAQLAVAAVCGAMAVLSLAGGVGLGWLFVLAFLVAVADSFENPAAGALLPNLVEREHFPAAVVVVASIRNAAWASGPVLAGLLIAQGDVGLAYAAMAGLVLASVVTLALLGKRVRVEEGRQVSWAAVREGISFVWHRQPVLGCMTLDLFAVIFAGVTALLPVFAKDMLGAGPRGFGLLAGALQIGTFAMAALLVVLPPIRRPGRALLFAVLGFGLATLLFGVSRHFELSMAALILAGMADEVSMVTRSTIIQLSTPDSLRGRVSAVNMVFIGASNQLGAAESGFLAALTSATFSVLFGGLACLATLGIVSWRMPELRSFHLEEGEE